MAIKQPQDIKIKSVKGSAGAEFKFIWNKDFAKRMNSKISSAQKVIDSETFRYSVPYMPMGIDQGSGKLIKDSQNMSAPLVGTGRIVYSGPSARLHYYGLLMVGKDTGSAWAKKGEKKVVATPQRKMVYHGAPKRGSHWVDRSWKDHGKQVVDAAQKAFDKE